MSDPTTGTPAPLKVLVYSDDVNTRQQVILALGRRPHPDLPELTYVEVATEPVVLQGTAFFDRPGPGGTFVKIFQQNVLPGL